ncbi:DEAD/DEAH box helicase family protein [Mycobacterium nebraskense]|nr:DEAD/DEAH box helicase family protein [Mycobacterium nebraskense]
MDARQERALIVAACGTGKTLMAVHAVAKLLDGRPGAVLVTFPTLGLLEQTYRTWQQQARFDFAALGVCSAHLRDTEDIHSDELSIASTTSPQRVAAWRAGLTGVGVAFCTYHRGRLRCSMRRIGPRACRGNPLPRRWIRGRSRRSIACSTRQPRRSTADHARGPASRDGARWRQWTMPTFTARRCSPCRRATRSSRASCRRSRSR